MGKIRHHKYEQTGSINMVRTKPTKKRPSNARISHLPKKPVVINRIEHLSKVEVYRINLRPILKRLKNKIVVNK